MRYFFHHRQGGQLLKDLEGIELPGLEAVKSEAELGAREIIGEAIKTGAALHLEHGFEVADESGLVVHTLPFSAVLLSFIAASPPSAVRRRSSA